MSAPREIRTRMVVIAEPLVPTAWRWRATFNSLASSGLFYGANGRALAFKAAQDWIAEVYALDHAIDDRRLQDEPTADRCILCGQPGVDCRCGR